jgi:hypothetical protein
MFSQIQCGINTFQLKKTSNTLLHPSFRADVCGDLFHFCGVIFYLSSNVGYATPTSFYLKQLPTKSQEKRAHADLGFGERGEPV